MHEGIKNRHSGSHELNKDSSRSHSILTVYLISETENKEDNHIFKKYGKIFIKSKNINIFVINLTHFYHPDHLKAFYQSELNLLFLLS